MDTIYASEKTASSHEVTKASRKIALKNDLVYEKMIISITHHNLYKIEWNIVFPKAIKLSRNTPNRIVSPMIPMLQNVGVKSNQFYT